MLEGIGARDVSAHEVFFDHVFERRDPTKGI
jgi:hypothetical protein